MCCFGSWSRPRIVQDYPNFVTVPNANDKPKAGCSEHFGSRHVVSQRLERGDPRYPFNDPTTLTKALGRQALGQRNFPILSPGKRPRSSKRMRLGHSWAAGHWGRIHAGSCSMPAGALAARASPNTKWKLTKSWPTNVGFSNSGSPFGWMVSKGNQGKQPIHRVPLFGETQKGLNTTKR